MKVTFWSYKGGTGRTIALANVAVELTHRRKNVGMIDLDLDAPGLYVLFKKDKEEINKRGHLGDILKSGTIGTISSTIMDINFTESQPVDGKLYLFPTINTPFLDELKFDDKMFMFINQVFDQFIKIYRLDYLLIDTRTGFSVLGALGQKFSDLTIVCFRPDQQDTLGVKEALKSFELNRTSFDFVCTPVPDLPNSAKRIKEAERLFGKKISVKVGLEPNLLLEEKILILTDPDNVVCESYRKIADLMEGIE